MTLKQNGDVNVRRIQFKVKLELFFYEKKKKMSPPIRNKKIKTSLNKITNRNNAYFSSINPVSIQ